MPKVVFLQGYGRDSREEDWFMEFLPRVGDQVSFDQDPDESFRGLYKVNGVRHQLSRSHLPVSLISIEKVEGQT